MSWSLGCILLVMPKENLQPSDYSSSDLRAHLYTLKMAEGDQFTSLYGDMMLSEAGDDVATMSFAHYQNDSEPRGRAEFLVWNGGPISPGTLWSNGDLGPMVVRRSEDDSSIVLP